MNCVNNLLFTFSADVNNLDNYRTVHETASSSQKEELSRQSEKSPAKKRRHISPETKTQVTKKPRKSKPQKVDKPIKSVDKSAKSVEKSPKKASLEIDVNREIVPQLASIVKTSTAIANTTDKKSKKKDSR
jgi:hypothetical protein